MARRFFPNPEEWTVDPSSMYTGMVGELQLQQQWQQQQQRQESQEQQQQQQQQQQQPPNSMYSPQQEMPGNSMYLARFSPYQSQQPMTPSQQQQPVYRNTMGQLHNEQLAFQQNQQQQQQQQQEQQQQQQQQQQHRQQQQGSNYLPPPYQPEYRFPVNNKRMNRPPQYEMREQWTSSPDAASPLPFSPNTQQQVSFDSFMQMYEQRNVNSSQMKSPDMQQQQSMSFNQPQNTQQNFMFDEQNLLKYSPMTSPQEQQRSPRLPSQQLIPNNNITKTQQSIEEDEYSRSMAVSEIKSQIPPALSLQQQSQKSLEAEFKTTPSSSNNMSVDQQIDQQISPTSTVCSTQTLQSEGDKSEEKNNPKSDRYVNTMSALEKAGLLEITLQTAQLMKRNASLQKDIDMLEEIVKVTKYLMKDATQT